MHYLDSPPPPPQIQQLKAQKTAREADLSQQKQEMLRQQQLLEKLRKEEQELREGVEVAHSDLTRLQASSQTMDNNISQVQQQVWGDGTEREPHLLFRCRTKLSS